MGLKKSDYLEKLRLFLDFGINLNNEIVKRIYACDTRQKLDNEATRIILNALK